MNKDLKKLKAMGATIGPAAKLPDFDHKKRRSKYGNVKTTVNGRTFDSKREADRYSELLLLEKAGEISNLELQPEFPVLIGGVEVFVYVADFKYWDMKKKLLVTEDAKGFKTPVYRLKKRCVEAQYIMKIIEV